MLLRHSVVSACVHILCQLRLDSPFTARLLEFSILRILHPILQVITSYLLQLASLKPIVWFWRARKRAYVWVNSCISSWFLLIASGFWKTRFSIFRDWKRLALAAIKSLESNHLGLQTRLPEDRFHQSFGHWRETTVVLQDECLTPFYLSPTQNILPFYPIGIKASCVCAR